MGVLALVGFGWLATHFQRPLSCAAWVTALVGLLNLALAGPSFALGIEVVLLGVYTALYYSLLVQVADTIALWLAVLIGGALLWFGVGFVFVQ